MASEMLYPIMPIFLKSIGFSALLIGILEGIAEATAGLSKGYFGKLSDEYGRRKPFVQLGYALSGLAKPLFAIAVTPLWIFFVRTLDKLGKGIRTGARDAILSDEATPETKGTVFGLHRSMDTAGAVLGPSIALVYLYFYPEDYKTLFLLAFLPGVLALLTTTFIKEKQLPTKTAKRIPFFSFLSFWKSAPASYRKLIVGLLGFALVNSSDVFLLLKAKEAGLSDTGVIGVYIFYNLIYALFALPLGMLADKLGLKNIALSGIMLFAVVYGCLTFATDIPIFLVLFFFYGVYAAATEGVFKAWITNQVDKRDTATAIGTYAAFQSICAMLASFITGLLWYKFGSNYALWFIAFSSIMVVIYLALATKNTIKNPG